MVELVVLLLIDGCFYTNPQITVFLYLQSYCITEISIGNEKIGIYKKQITVRGKITMKMA